MSTKEKPRQPQRNKKHRPRVDELDGLPRIVSISSVTDITLLAQPRDGQTPEERLDDVCLEICRRYPFGGSPDNKLVSSSTPDEREEMLALADAVGVGVEGLVRIIRGSQGVQSQVLKKLNELKSDKKM